MGQVVTMLLTQGNVIIALCNDGTLIRAENADAPDLHWQVLTSPPPSTAGLMKKASDEGMQARRMWEPASANPHDHDTASELWASWRDGWTYENFLQRE